MVSGAEGTIKLYNLHSPNSVNLDNFKVGGYILVLFVFHLDVHDYNNLKSKIIPPKLFGVKMGIFATRTPHRYNPIGLSICKIEQVEEEEIRISGIDLVNGTPIMGLEVYTHKHFVPPGDLRIPEWLEDTKSTVIKVSWDEQAESQIQGIYNEGIGDERSKTVEK